MRLVWCASEGVSADRCHCGGLYVHSRCTGCRIHHTRRDALKRERGLKPAAVRFYHPLVGPRQRLPQAKDVPEGVILAIMRAHPLKTFTHWRGEHIGMDSLPNLSPELAAFPEKVLHAKLKSMARRGLIRGWGDSRMRGDWSAHLGRYYGK